MAADREDLGTLPAALAAAEARAQAAETKAACAVAEATPARAVVTSSEAVIAALKLEILKLRREIYGHHRRLLFGPAPRGRPATRLDAKGLVAPWPDLMRDLARLQAVIVHLDGTRYRMRTDCLGHAAKAFQAAGVAIPTAVTALGPIPSPKQPRAT